MLKLQQSSGNAEQISLLSLNRFKRRRLLRGAGRMVRRNSRARLRSQQDLDGKAWKSRADGSKRKMFKKLSKKMRVFTGGEKVDVGYSTLRTGQIARAHHEGITTTVKAGGSEFGESNTPPPKSKMCTKKQAKALRKAGYKIRRKGTNGWKRPGLKWMQENLSSNRAGLILRIMRSSEKKKEWDIHRPVRTHLGQDRDEEKDLKNFMLSEAIRLTR